jgi:hypothetical protein
MLAWLAKTTSRGVDCLVMILSAPLLKSGPALSTLPQPAMDTSLTLVANHHQLALCKRVI